MKENLELVNL